MKNPLFSIKNILLSFISFTLFTGEESRYSCKNKNETNTSTSSSSQENSSGKQTNFPSHQASKINPKKIGEVGAIEKRNVKASTNHPLESKNSSVGKNKETSISSTSKMTTQDLLWQLFEISKVDEKLINWVERKQNDKNLLNIDKELLIKTIVAKMAKDINESEDSDLNQYKELFLKVYENLTNTEYQFIVTQYNQYEDEVYSLEILLTKAIDIIVRMHNSPEYKAIESSDALLDLEDLKDYLAKHSDSYLTKK